MKDIFKIVVGIVLIGQLSLEAETYSSFIKNLAKITKTKSDNIGRQISKNGNLIAKQIKTKIDNIPSIPKSIKQNPSKLLIATKANNIIKKGPFEKQFFLSKSFDTQTAIIIQSAKYGDEYFRIAKKISTKNFPLISQNKIISKYLPSKKYINLTENQLQQKFVDALKYTGSKGWDALKGISKFAINNPTYTSLGAAYLWFSVDPNGYLEAVNNSGKSILDFLDASAKEANKTLKEYTEEKVYKIFNQILDDMKKGNFKSLYNFLFPIFMLVLGFILWKKRKIIYIYLFEADKIKYSNKRNYKKENDEF